MKALLIAFAPAALLVALVVLALEYAYVRPLAAEACGRIAKTVQQFDHCFAEVLR